MAIIPKHIVDDILQTARIEEVIGEFVQLKRAGSNLKGLSPFTDEKTPSFMVSPAKQIFKCFSTGKGGSVATFLMEKEHYTYPEALRWLADKYGIAIPEDRAPTAEEIAERSERESLHIINEFAAKHFKGNLHEHEEGRAIGLSYFVERGFRKDIIDKFQLGYCLNTGHDLTDALKEKGYKSEYAETVGLIKRKDDRTFDFFRGRVMFPIHSISGRVLGFGGRTLFTDKKVAKYFNSPESIIYNKSEILYGLYFSKSEIIKRDNCFLCEGYTDVISMFQAGIENVVSSSGTSLTKEQIRLVKRYTNNITILYDGDAAGIKASFRGIDLILEEGLNVKVVLFPDGEDPDSYSKKVSSSELEEYIQTHQQDFISFKADILLQDGQNDPIQRAELIREIVHSVGLIPDQITRTVFIQKIASEFDIDETILTSELVKFRSNQQKSAAARPTTEEQPPLVDTPQTEITSPIEDLSFPMAEFGLIRLLVKYGDYELTFHDKDTKGQLQERKMALAEFIVQELDADDLRFTTPVYEKILVEIEQALAENKLLKSSYFLRLEDNEIVQCVTEIETNEHEISRNWLLKHKIFVNTEVDKLTQAAEQALYTFKIYSIEKIIQDIRNELERENLSDEELIALLSEQKHYEIIKMEFSKHLGITILR